MVNLILPFNSSFLVLLALYYYHFALLSLSHFSTPSLEHVSLSHLALEPFVLRPFARCYPLCVFHPLPVLSEIWNLNRIMNCPRFCIVQTFGIFGLCVPRLSHNCELQTDQSLEIWASSLLPHFQVKLHGFRDFFYVLEPTDERRWHSQSKMSECFIYYYRLNPRTPLETLLKVFERKGNILKLSCTSKLLDGVFAVAFPTFCLLSVS